METLKLDTAVGLLTRLSPHRLVDEEGGVRWVTADPLLVQLQLAVGNSAAPALFKGSGNPLPMSADAHDLLMKIVNVTIDYWWQLHTIHKGMGRESVAGRLRGWALAARSNPDHLAVAEKIICGWVEEIQALFQPRRRWEIRGACPSCGFRRVVDREDDGQTFMKPALAVLYEPDGRTVSCAECSACRSSWGPDQVIWLAELVAAQPDEEDPEEPDGDDAA